MPWSATVCSDVLVAAPAASANEQWIKQPTTAPQTGNGSDAHASPVLDIDNVRCYYLLVNNIIYLRRWVG